MLQLLIRKRYIMLKANEIKLSTLLGVLASQLR